MVTVATTSGFERTVGRDRCGLAAAIVDDSDVSSVLSPRTPGYSATCADGGNASLLVSESRIPRVSQAALAKNLPDGRDRLVDDRGSIGS